VPATSRRRNVTCKTPSGDQIIANATSINPNMPIAMIVFVVLSNWMSPTPGRDGKAPRPFPDPGGVRA
jgi:hypothetical protein